MSSEHEQWMRMAIEEAEKAASEGNMAVGAVIVHGGTVVARGRNEASSTFDVTAHAETVAIRQLSVRLHVVNPCRQWTAEGRDAVHDLRAVSDVRVGDVHRRSVDDGDRRPLCRYGRRLQRVGG